MQIVGINSNQQDTLQEIAGYARVHKIDFPAAEGPGGEVADQFGATPRPRRSCSIVSETFATTAASTTSTASVLARNAGDNY